MTWARNPCYLTNIFIIIGQFTRADWLRAAIDKCKSDGFDEMMAQFIFFFLSGALFFNKLQWKWTSMKSVNVIVKKKLKNMVRRI